LIERHLKFFVAVAEEENLHRAAQRLNIAQSALSRRIQDLEAELGVTLFERSKRTMQLNDAGRDFLASAQRILADLDRARADVHKVAEGSMGTLSLGYNEIAFRHPAVVALLKQFRVDNPDIHIALQHMISGRQAEQIKQGALDAGLLYNHYVDDEELSALHLFEDSMVLAIHQDHPLAGKPDLSLLDLRHEPFIWASRALAPMIFDRMIAAFQAQGISPRIEMQVPYSHLILDLVAAGFGSGFVTRMVEGGEPPSVRLIALPDFDLRTRYDLVWARRNRSAILKRFVDEVRSHLGQPGGAAQQLR